MLHSLLLSSSYNNNYPPSPPLSHQTMSSTKNAAPSFLNLEKVVSTYGSQPELLQLILSSKVEEDRRRAEEAKLRRKEIDYMLQQQQQQKQQLLQGQPKQQPTSLLPPMHSHNSNNKQKVESTLPSLNAPSAPPPPPSHYRQKSYQYDSLPPLPTSSNWTTYDKPISALSPAQAVQATKRRRNSSNIEKLLIPSPKSLEELKLPELSLTPSSSSSTIRNMINYPNKRSRSSSLLLTNEEKSCSSSDSEQEQDNNKAAGPALLLPPSPPVDKHKRRRRREMQAITTMIETREFPYNDDYLWKNNGNTIHKKTGFKSIYYKCSNSSKDCPVNKTVTFKENGQHLIKYRGQHLNECHRIKRITDL